MQKVKIITDSASDIPNEYLEKYNIRMIPLGYTLDGETYLKDRESQTSEEFFETLRNSDIMPKTSQITDETFEEVFLEELKNHETIICILMSSVASGTFQRAFITKQKIDKDDRIVLIDSMTFSYVYGRAVVEVAKMAQEGKEREEIVHKINDILKRSDAYFITETLEYLKRGGRINAATVFAANLLDIKPTLGIEGGLVVGAGKIRGSKKLYAKLIKFIIDKGIDLNGQDLAIIHSSTPEAVEEAKNALLAACNPKSLIVVSLGAIIGSHAGYGLMGINFLRD